MEDQVTYIIKKGKEHYYKIGAIPCPAFGGELVYFNKHGWNHLLNKNSAPRSNERKHFYSIMREL